MGSRRRHRHRQKLYSQPQQVGDRFSVIPHIEKAPPSSFDDLNRVFGITLPFLEPQPGKQTIDICCNEKWFSVDKDSVKDRLPIQSTMIVTPQWADETLRLRNKVNRHIDDRRVRIYVRQILDGSWEINNDDVCFYEDGSLANGQHRLAAVVVAKSPTKLSFKFGIKTEAMVTIDEGRRRSNLDVAKLMGIHTNKKCLAATSFLLEILGVKVNMVREQILDFARFHEDAAIFATKDMNKPPFNKAPIYSAIIKAYYHVDKSRLQQFIDILVTGEKQNIDAPGAAWRFREWIISIHAGAHSQAVREIIYRKALAAIKHFCEHNDVSKLYQATDDLWPLPQEEYLFMTTVD